jgi:hypothetical protein
VLGDIQSSKEGHTAKRLFHPLLYDISKAYDSIKWTSIRESLELIGAPEDFITFIMNTLKGTKLSMKTGTKRGFTKMVEINKSIKQGCPMAPLLFIILMDHMHRGYSDIGGFSLGKNSQTTVSSGGYVDDTAIISKNERMDQHIHESP